MVSDIDITVVCNGA